MRLSAALIVCSFVGWLPAHAATPFTITLNPGSFISELETNVSADGTGGAHVRVFKYPTALPYSDTSTSVAGVGFASSEYNLSNDGFYISLDHSNSGGETFTNSTGNIYFSVDEDVSYVASGSYSLTDSDGRHTALSATLYDITGGVGGAPFVFESVQVSGSTPNENFTLGLSEGDFSNTLIGSLTGTLLAGHDYRFYYDPLVIGGPTSSFTASGCVGLSFGTSTDCVAVFPEPGSSIPVMSPVGLFVFAAGLLGFIGYYRRRL